MTSVKGADLLAWWDPNGPALTPAQRRQLQRKPLKRGHAGTPGKGPAGETCGSCRHLARNQQAKVYLKCSLAIARWTHGAGTDVRAHDPSCEQWERQA